jgi:histone H3/H4
MIQDDVNQEAIVTGVQVDGKEGESEELVEATVINQEEVGDSAPVVSSGGGVEEMTEQLKRDSTEIKKEKKEHMTEEDNNNDNNASPSSIKKKRKRQSSSNTPVRSKVASGGAAIPNAKDLFVPFRVTKRIMKVDKDIGTVQNEAAMVATYALELFIERMMEESYENAIKRGRNTVK